MIGAGGLKLSLSQCRFRSKMNSEPDFVDWFNDDDESQCRFRSKMNSETKK